MIRQDERHTFRDPAPCVRLLRRRCTACRCHNLEGCAFPVVLGLGREERSDEAFDLPRVELGRWCVGESSWAGWESHERAASRF